MSIYERFMAGEWITAVELERVDKTERRKITDEPAIYSVRNDAFQRRI